LTEVGACVRVGGQQRLGCLQKGGDRDFVARSCAAGELDRDVNRQRSAREHQVRGLAIECPAQ
jgi:hypothetical protein